jgi:hypothetical protein
MNDDGEVLDFKQRNSHLTGTEQKRSAICERMKSATVRVAFWSTSSSPWPRLSQTVFFTV